MQIYLKELSRMGNNESNAIRLIIEQNLDDKGETRYIKKTGETIYKYNSKEISDKRIANEVAKHFHRLKMPYPMKDIVNDVKILRKNLQVWENMRYLNKSMKIPERFYRPAQFHVDKNYTTTFRFTKIVKFPDKTEQISEEYFTVTHDDLHSIKDLAKSVERFAKGRDKSSEEFYDRKKRKWYAVIRNETGEIIAKIPISGKKIKIDNIVPIHGTVKIY